MSTGSPSAPVDPEERLREAIVTFEQAQTARTTPDPQEWLVRYPEVADRLTEYFRLRGLLTSSPSRSEETSVSVLPLTPYPQATAGLPELDSAERATELANDPRRSPAMGIGAAFGRCLLAALIVIAVGIAVGIAIRIFRIRFDRHAAGPAWMAMTSVVLGFLGHRWLGTSARRRMALRGIASIHLVLILLLIPPLFLVATQVGTWVALALGTTFAQQPRAAYIDIVDKVFDSLVQQPWFIVLVTGCLLPAVGEEIFFRAFLGRGLVARYGGVRGVIYTAILFGLMHIDPVQIGPVTLLGLVCHVAYLCTKTVLAPMLLHSLYNGVGLSLHKLYKADAFLPLGPDGVLPIPPLLFLSAVVILLATLFALFRMRTRWLGADGEELSPGYATAAMPPVSLGGRARLEMRPALLALVGVGYLAFLAASAPSISTWLNWDRYWGLLQRADALAKSGDLRQAVAFYDQAILAVPDEAAPYFERGLAYHNMAKYELAVKDYSEAIRLNPTHAFAFGNRGRCYQSLNRHDDAIADATTAMTLDPKQAAEWYLDRGLAYQSLRKYREASEDYTLFLRVKGADAVAYANRAACFNEMRAYDKALADASTAIRLDDNQVLPYVDRGIALQNLGKFEEAADDYTEAITRDKALVWAYQNRATLYNQKGEYEKALADTEEGIRLKPSDCFSHFERGCACQNLRKYEEAISSFSKAIELHPPYAAAYQNRGWTYLQLKQYQKAIADYDKAVELGLRLASTYLDRGVAHHNLRDLDRALADYTEAIRIDPSFALAYANRSLIYAERGNHEQAEADRETARKLKK